jgi:cephalosporin-C deacetylase
MALVDWPLATLETYLPDRVEPADFDAFWTRTLPTERGADPVFQPYDAILSTVDVFDVTFAGFAGHPVRGWLLTPRGAREVPCVVTYVGYGGGRGLPHDWLVFSAAGYAHFIMDTRGQGGGWLAGDTPDRVDHPLDSQHPGYTTRGVLSPDTYYYRRLIADAVAAVAAARQAPGVDPGRIAVAGGSQGGGVALAVAGLAGGVKGGGPEGPGGGSVKVALVDVPFLCHWRRAMEVSTQGPYAELVNYCKVQRDRVDQVWHTLSYVDGLNFAVRAREVAALFSVGLMDPTCPPSTVFAAYNHYAGPKEMCVWPYNGHEGGQTHQVRRQLEFLARNL